MNKSLQRYIVNITTAPCCKWTFIFHFSIVDNFLSYRVCVCVTYPHTMTQCLNLLQSFRFGGGAVLGVIS